MWDDVNPIFKFIAILLLIFVGVAILQGVFWLTWSVPIGFGLDPPSGDQTVVVQVWEKLKVAVKPLADAFSHECNGFAEFVRGVIQSIVFLVIGIAAFAVALIISAFIVAIWAFLFIFLPVKFVKTFFEERTTPSRVGAIILSAFILFGWGATAYSWGIIPRGYQSKEVQTTNPSSSATCKPSGSSGSSSASGMSSTTGSQWMYGNGYNQGGYSEETRANPVFPITYIGNKKTKVYHLSGCRYLPDAKNQVPLGSKSYANSMGYKPCGHCNP